MSGVFYHFKPLLRNIYLFSTGIRIFPMCIKFHSLVSQGPLGEEEEAHICVQQRRQTHPSTKSERERERERDRLDIQNLD
jgi:hypothetical protein